MRCDRHSMDNTNFSHTNTRTKWIERESESEREIEERKREREKKQKWDLCRWSATWPTDPGAWDTHTQIVVCNGFCFYRIVIWFNEYATKCTWVQLSNRSVFSSIFLNHLFNQVRTTSFYISIFFFFAGSFCEAIINNHCTSFSRKLKPIFFLYFFQERKKKWFEPARKATHSNKLSENIFFWFRKYRK